MSSPIARALIGKYAGDTVDVQAPGGVRQYEVLDVHVQINMRRFWDGLAGVMLVLWIGGMWAIGYVAAPVLFANLGDKQLAGMLAGKLFKLMAWIGMAAASYLLIYRHCPRWRRRIEDPVFLGGDADAGADPGGSFRHSADHAKPEGSGHAACGDAKRVCRPLCPLARDFEHSLSDPERDWPAAGVAFGAGAISPAKGSGREGDHRLGRSAINYQYLADLLHRRRAGGGADFFHPGTAGIQLIAGSLDLDQFVRFKAAFDFLQYGLRSSPDCRS